MHNASPLSIAGEIIVTCGVVVLLFAFYEAFWTNLGSARLQQHAQEDLVKQWQSPQVRDEVELGDAFARMSIPSFGKDWSYAVLEGTDAKTLATGPGHYVGTGLPGHPGNVALAGHRIGRGGAFNNLGALRPCDEIVIETRTQIIEYRVLPMAAQKSAREDEAAACFAREQKQRIVDGDYARIQGRRITSPDDVGVISPIPGAETASGPGLEQLLTLTTCHPEFSNAQRMIIHAMATRIETKKGN